MMTTSQQPTRVDERGTSEHTTTNQRDIFLAYFDNPRRSFVTNLFLHAVRRGERTPRRVLAAVNAEIRACQERAQYWGREDSSTRYDEAQEVILLHPDEALAFCSWALDWERLTPAEKRHYRGAQGEQFRRDWMKQQPATDRQIAYVRALGYTGEVTSKAHASELIDQLRNRQSEVRA